MLDTCAAIEETTAINHNVFFLCFIIVNCFTMIIHEGLDGI